jgi:hypothetical protein
VTVSAFGASAPTMIHGIAALARQEEEIRFAPDSLLEEDGFELLVPPQRGKP